LILIFVKNWSESLIIVRHIFIIILLNPSRAIDSLKCLRVFHLNIGYCMNHRDFLIICIIYTYLKMINIVLV